jgi:endonuclease/exonuclease/phosphatase family metal-dependent hydrolase
LHLTNVYAPTARTEKPLFLSELASLGAEITGPWIIIGDFNFTRSPEDKNSENFLYSDADMFNSTINYLALIELPLVDCSYTWSNRRDEPTLILLDHYFINTDWHAIFPNSSLTSCRCFRPATYQGEYPR